VKVEVLEASGYAGYLNYVCCSQIRREFHCFTSKVAENPAFVSKMLQQSLDFHQGNFSRPRVLIYESDEASHPPTFE
jgi:hypothetical protein